MNQETQNQKMGQIIARCWTDAAFKARLLSDPADVFKTEGLPVPAGVALRVLENTDRVSHLIIPARPVELTDEALNAVAGGASLRDQLLASNKHKPRL